MLTNIKLNVSNYAIFSLKNFLHDYRGKSENILKGEIMGLDFDPTKYGMKDYAAEFKTKTEQQSAYNRGRMDALGITVPIGRETTTAPAEKTPADAVRNDLGVSFGNTTPKTDDTDKTQTDTTTENTTTTTEDNKSVDETKSTTQTEETEKAEETTQQPAVVEPQTVEQVQEQIMFTDDNAQLTTPRTLHTEEGRNNAIAKAKADFIANGREDGTAVTADEAQGLAEDYVRNETYKEGFYSTRTYLTKNEYKAAENLNKQAKKDYYDDLRKQGIGRREAKRRTNEWAEQNLVHNEHLKNKDALKYIEAHRDQFYDENGNFSQAKYKQFCEGLMNEHTQAGETRNYFLSLKERRDAAHNLQLDDDAVCDMVHRASDDKDYNGNGRNWEKDYTEVKQIAIIGGATAVAATAGALLIPGVKVGAGAASSAGAVAGGVTGGTAGGAVAGSAAAAGATATVEYGALAGVPVAVGGAWVKDLFKDNGGPEKEAYAPAKPQPVDEEQEDDQEQQVCELTPDEYHDVIQEEVNYCTHTIIKGDDPYKIVMAKYRHEDGSRLSHTEALQIAHELKMIHGCTNYRDALNMKVGDEFRCYTEFDGLAHPNLKGKKYIVDCDAETDGKSSKDPMKGRIHNFDGQYNGAKRDYNIDQYWYTDCNNNRSNIFATAGERDVDMARRQAELNAAAGK